MPLLRISLPQAEERVDEFLSNPALCVEVIWAAERQRFVEEEKGLDQRAKNWVHYEFIYEGIDKLAHTFH